MALAYLPTCMVDLHSKYRYMYHTWIYMDPIGNEEILVEGFWGFNVWWVKLGRNNLPRWIVDEGILFQTDGC